MSRSFKVLATVVVVALVVGVGYGAWRYAELERLRPYLSTTYFMADFSDGFAGPSGSRVAIAVPEAHELLGVLLALVDMESSSSELIQRGTAYHAAALEYFAPFAQHPAVAVVRSRLDVFPSHRCLFAYAIYDDRLEQNPRYDVAWLGQRAFGEDLDLLADFARVSDFGSFYAAHESYYESQIETFESMVDPAGMVAWLEALFAQRYESFLAAISPLTGGSHNIWLFRDRTLRTHEAVMFVPSPDVVLDAPPEIAAGLLARSFFTELNHNYVNPTTDQTRHLRQVVRAFADQAAWYSRPGYDSPALIFNEYMTWGLFALYAVDAYPADTAEWLVNQTVTQMERRGFLRYGAFQAELLRIYQEQRDAAGADGLFGAILQWARGQ